MTTNKTTAEGVFKTVFGDALENTVPDFMIVGEDIGFVKRAKVGKEYRFPIRVQRSHGVTFKGGDDSYDAFTLNNVVTGQTKDAIVTGTMCVIRESVGYGATIAAMEAGNEAFVDLYAEAVSDTMNSIGFYLEAALLYGQGSNGIGAVESTNSISGTAGTIVLTAATSAVGLWAQMQGAHVDAWTAGYAALVNSNADLVVGAVTFDTSTQKLSIAVTGNNTDLNALAATNILVPKGWNDASAGQQIFAGLDKIITNTGSLFNISASSFPTWAGNTFTAGSGRLNFQKLIQAQVQIVNRYGLARKKLMRGYMSAITWANILDNQAALRREVSNSATFELGSDKIIFHGPGGSIQLVAHPMVMPADCFVGVVEEVVRGGKTPITFKHPTSDGNNRFLRELADQAGFEFRGMWDQFIVVKKPRSWCKITNIVNGTT